MMSLSLKELIVRQVETYTKLVLTMMHRRIIKLPNINFTNPLESRLIFPRCLTQFCSLTHYIFKYYIIKYIIKMYL